MKCLFLVEKSCPLKQKSSSHFNRGSQYRSVILAISSSFFCAAGARAQSTPPATPGSPPPPDNLTTPAPSLNVPTLEQPKVVKNDLGVSGDFMYGLGTVTLPVGFALAGSNPQGNLKSEVISANRSTLYYGGTVSYSYGRSWYLDFSYEQGTSTGNQSISIPNTIFGSGVPGSIRANFNINDDDYFLYLRYNFQNFMQGTRFRAYLRGGVSLVQATLTANDASTPSYYEQTDKTTDIMGNLGFGLTYAIYTNERFRLGLQVEGEGFYGDRSQDSTETLPVSQLEGLSTAHATINNSLYGGIARGTLHADFRMGQSGRLKLTADLGAQIKYTLIDYSGASAPNELLYGPYVKLGLSYLF